SASQKPPVKMGSGCLPPRRDPPRPGGRGPPRRVPSPPWGRGTRAAHLGAPLPPGAPRRIDLHEFQRFLRAQGRPAYPIASEPRTRVLLVDDEPLVVQMLHDLLVDGPFVIETATDGYEALVKVGTFRPALIILDVVLAG